MSTQFVKELVNNNLLPIMQRNLTSSKEELEKVKKNRNAAIKYISDTCKDLAIFNEDGEKFLLKDAILEMAAANLFLKFSGMLGKEIATLLILTAKEEK